MLCFIVFCLNFFAATQDIAVDGIAVALLSHNELGKGNTAQVVGYKIGSIFGGGVLVWFMDSLGWSGLFLVLTLLYIEALLFIYLSPTLRKLHYTTVYHSKKDTHISDSEKRKSNPSRLECDSEPVVLIDDFNSESEEGDNKTDSSDSMRSDSFEIIENEQGSKDKVTNQEEIIKEIMKSQDAQDKPISETDKKNENHSKEIDRSGDEKSNGEESKSEKSNGQDQGSLSGEPAQSSDRKTENPNSEKPDIKSDSSKSEQQDRKSESFKSEQETQPQEAINLVQRKSNQSSKESTVQIENVSENIIYVHKEQTLFTNVEWREFEPTQQVEKWTRCFTGTKVESIHEMMVVPGTMWMLIYVLVYKLGTVLLHLFCMSLN